MVIDKCTKYMNAVGQQVELKDKDKEEMKTHIKKVAGDGFRVLGIAIGLDGGNMKDITAENSHDLLSDVSSYQ